MKSSLKLHFYKVVFTSTFLLSFHVTLAQNSEEFNTLTNIERLRRQEEENKFRKLEADRRRTRNNDLKKNNKNDEPNKNGLYKKNRQCVIFGTIKITGDPFLTNWARKKIIGDMQGQCLGPDEIGYLIRTINDYYTQSGQITTRVYLPPQDLNKGILELRVVPGLIESLTFADPSMGYKSELLTAFPGIVGQRLNLPQLEQGVGQMNRIPYHQARIRLLPGSKPGYSKVLIDNENKKIFGISWNIDNNGSIAVGQLQTNASFSMYDLFKLNESWSFTASSSLPDLKNDYNNYSRYWSFNGSLPLGFWTFSYFRNSSEFQLHSSNSGLFKVYYTTKTVTDILSIERVVYKTPEAKTTLSASKTLIKSQQFILNEIQPGTSNHTNSLKLGLTHSHQAFLGYFNFNFNYILGNLQTDNQNLNNPQLRTNPDLQYTKITTGLSYEAPFQIQKQNFSFETNYQVQITRNILIPNEQFSIGGNYTVRGYRNQTLNADQGWFLRNEFAWYISGTTVDTEQVSFWGSPSIFIAYDYGTAIANTRVPSIGTSYQSVGDIHGIAFGISSKGRNGNYNITLSQSVRWPTHFYQEQVVSAGIGFNY